MNRPIDKSVIDQYLKGNGLDEIAKALDITTASVRRILRDNGVEKRCGVYWDEPAPRRDRKYLVTEELKSQVLKLFNQGISQLEVARTLAISRDFAQKIYEAVGIKASDRAPPKIAGTYTEKRCATCKQTKPVANFRKRKGIYADGTERISFESSCKECEKITNSGAGLRHYYRYYRSDPGFRLRHIVSFAVGNMLRKTGGSKDGHSCLEYLPWTIEKLRTHLETLFEFWMTWGNYGAYYKEEWNDDDPSTWRWQVDHIVPQSKLPYASMEDKNFKKVWALENLRPLSAKQNQLDGARRTRHK